MKEIKSLQKHKAFTLAPFSPCCADGLILEFSLPALNTGINGISAFLKVQQFRDIKIEFNFKLIFYSHLGCKIMPLDDMSKIAEMISETHVFN